uniref:Auxin-responsive protein n=1 Tax=Rhizophora mucronata TaxID=61149 RepID=A0A2P2LH09_RHIMU
MGMTLGRV